jgi:hypothetical protein
LKEKFIILTIVLGLTTCTYIVENDLTTNSPIATINDSTTTTKDIVIQADNAFELHKNYLVKDIDDDNVKDTIYVDLEKSTIVCKLSSNGFKEISSKPIGILNLQSGVIETRNGFEFFNDWMRAGYKNKFIYNNKTKKIQLIGMSRYEYGNAVHDGSGESSVNLLTADYVGDWNYFDLLANNEEGELVKIPTIKIKMNFEVINLEDFDEEIYFDYAERCAKLYHKYKEIKMNTK